MHGTFFGDFPGFPLFPELVGTLTGTLKNSGDRVEMKAAFHLGLHSLLRHKQSSETKIHHFIESLTSNSSEYKM